MDFKKYFLFNKEQRIGFLGLVSIIIILQIVYWFADFSIKQNRTDSDEKWLSLQTQIDTPDINFGYKNYKIYPYNPNFLTDFKAYKLGMTTDQINRLLAFRKTNQYVNSSEEFQRVTKVSDSLLSKMAPFFKFPDWVTNKKENQYKDFKNEKFIKKPIVISDINQATKENLMEVYGIGEAISERILKQKETLGAFASMEQMQDIWGLSPEVIAELNSHYKVISTTGIKKLDINNAPTKELLKFPFFKYSLVKDIVTYRSMNSGIKNIEDLTKIKDFPVDKIKIIALYLEFN
jgi:DNA uptake protein ComE-like DNA-binding protein